MLIWASKFATAEIECSFEKGQANTFGEGGKIYFPGDGNRVIIFTTAKNPTILLELIWCPHF